MAVTITTRPGDRLDTLCARVYGRVHGVVEATLGANPSQAEALSRPLLPPGLVLTLPEPPAEDSAAPGVLRLWD